MKKKPNLLPFIIAGVFFLIAIFALIKYQQIQAQKQADAIAAQKAADQQAIDEAKKNAVQVTPTQTNMRTVLFATQPVDAGVRISPAFYEKKLTPNDILPDAYTDQSDITGWVAIRKIEKGDPLTPRNIGKSLPYMSQRIPPGMRAISLPVFNADYNNTGGFVVDGDKVDLLYTVDSLEGDIRLTTQTILQNVNILYVPGPPTKTEMTDGVTPVPAPGNTIAVTFLVTPEEAQELVFLSGYKNAKFSMILRSRKDDTEIKVKPFMVTDIDITNMSRIQRTADKSEIRVKALAAQIEAAEKKQEQGTTNETNTPPAAP